MNNPKSRGDSILIVDDQPENLKLLAAMLAQQGYRVRVALGGQRALQAARESPPGLILLDILMPDMGGYEVCERLKAEEETRDIPIIFISALGKTQDKVRAFDIGGVDYVTKPLHEAEVLARVETHLALQAMRRQLEERNTQLEWEVAERKRTEGELREHQQHLKEMVEERTAELVQANEALQQEIAERRRAEEAEREQRTLAEALRDTAEALNSTLDIDEVLDRILANIGRVVPCDAVNIHLLDEGSKTGRIFRIQGYVERDLGAPAVGKTYRLADLPISRQMVENRKPVVIADTQAHPGWVAFPETSWIRSYVSAPLYVQDDVLGFLNLDSATPEFFTTVHAQQLQAFADQAAVAIQNARLYSRLEKYSQVLEQEIEERTQTLRENVTLLQAEIAARKQAEAALRAAAATAERERLARDLHDAVTQTLFSASLIAEALPRVWERDPEEGRRGLEELRRLTRGASAEMRTLLLELRPATLTEKPLGELLRHLTEATTSRTRVPVTLTVEGNSALPPDMQIALYRIAQEALNNVAKHAGASQATVELHCQPEQVTLCVRDNGCSFDPDDVLPDRLGLGIMRERAERVGATLIIESEPGQGTQVTVVWENDE